MTQAETDVKKYGRLIRDKFEFKDVECEQTFDYEKDNVTTVRLDTEEVVESRGLRANERQQELDFTEAEEETTFTEDEVEIEEEQENEFGEIDASFEVVDSEKE